jgi:hypothetical protein
VRAELEDIIGLPLDRATTYAQHAINVISAEESEAALCAWFEPETAKRSERIKSWLSKNTLGMSGNYIPEKKQLDAWVTDLTRGLITEFPAEINGTELVIFASIIYTKFKWEQKFTVTDAPDAFVQWDVGTVLNTTDDTVRFIAYNDNVFAVITKKAVGYKNVTSIMSLIREYDDVAEYLKDAEQVMVGEGHGVPLNELEDVLDGSADVAIEYIEGQQDNTYEVWLPAWNAKAILNLNSPEIGIGRALTELSGSRDTEGEVVQSAVAKYTAEGFEGAAVTVAIMRGTAMVAPNEGAYAVTVMMNKPTAAFCVVAGIPLFSAVVTTADNG